MKRKLNVHSIGKCLLTLLLSLVLVVGVLPTTTWAASNTYNSDWRYWSQGDSYYWAMQKAGCRIVSQAKLLVEAGIAPSTFEPDIYFEWCANKNNRPGDKVTKGYVNSTSDVGETTTTASGMIQYAKVQGYTIERVGEASLLGKTADEKIATVWNYIQAGYYVILGCDEHHTYISRVDSLAAGKPMISETAGSINKSKNNYNDFSIYPYAGVYGSNKGYEGNFDKAYAYKVTPSGTSTTPTTPTTDISRDIVLVLDTSGSMSGTSLTYTKAAATKFVDQILDASKSTNIAIVTYAGSANTLIGLTNDKAALTKAIDGISTNGMTNIYTAMQAADTILQSSKANKKAIVIMSDGEANEGTTATAQTITTEEKDSVYFTDYGAAIYAQAEGYKKNSSYTIYSLGFGLEGDTNAYNLLKYIATYSNGARKFWSVTKDNLDDIVFTYEDIANTATAKIIIAIDCPVTAAISRGSETLDKDNTAASFGSVAVTSVTDGYKYVFTLDDGADYDIKIRGSADGAMNFKITYVYGDTEQYHGFQGVPITTNTLITTSKTDRTVNDFKLYIDNDNDGVADADWRAGANQIVYGPDDGQNPTKPDTGNVPDGFGGSDKINRAPSTPAETETTNEVTETPAETTATIASPKTGDMGVVVYAAMALLSMSGSAWLVSKKHRER